MFRLHLLVVFAVVPMAAQTDPESVSTILKTSCALCHTGAKAGGNLELDSMAHLAKGGVSGPAVVPGKPDESTLLQRVTTTDRSLRMPPAGPGLPPESVKILRDWVENGAPGLQQPVTAAIDFEKDIHPILEKSCFQCHSGTKPQSQLRLDVAAGIRQGGLGGPVVAPGKPDLSRLVHRIEGKGDEQRMPLNGDPLKPEEIAMIRTWIEQGAGLPVRPGAGEPVIEKHWSYVKPVRPPRPDVKSKDLITNPIDAFLLAKLESKGRTFSPPASKETLIRRVSLDLIGLPPSLAEVDAFVNDSRPDAYERLVDRLLASKHYGERWARHWLDLARYADTNGYEKDDRRTMWKFRDWVINAYNQDMPFDQFTTEQIAGDMLPNATTAQKIASGFHRNTMYNEEGGVDKDEAYFEVLVDRVATTSTVWLGSTIQCAQCHNHKYDPISHKEYYQLMAFFNNNDKGEQHYGDTSVKYREPELDLATPDQETRRTELTARIKQLENTLKTPTPELAEEQAAWERRIAQTKNDWKVLMPSTLRAESGSKLDNAGNGIIAASGDNPQSETYTFEAPVSLDTLSGLRIETLPDPSLPRGGPGRDVYGNFILTEVRVELGSGGKWQPVTFKEFIADDGRVLARNSNHLWTIDASREETRLARQLVLMPEQPVTLQPDAQIRISLVQQSELIGQNIGRFRLSVTADPDPAIIVRMRHRLRAALETAAERRTSEQSKELADFFRTIAPSLDPVRDELKARKDELKDLGIVTALVMQEKRGFERPFDHIRARGAFSAKAEKVYADVPAVLGSLPPSEMPNRLGLARWLASPENPLTARVTINRIWEHYFGRGIVETTEDFGTQGERPVHPELLDWLAVDFMENDWRLKRLHKLIVTSTAYRQTSKAAPDLLELDPYNRLISRGPRFRMEAEMIRDFGLKVSGLLSTKIGGPSVMPPQPEGVWDIPYSDDKWVVSKGEDRYRRGIYTFIRRSALYPAMMNFDAPSREVCTVRRSTTNSPLAALTTLNDEAFFEMAQALAKRIVSEGGATDQGRIEYGFRLVTSRKPTPVEFDRMQTWLSTEKDYFAKHPTEAGTIQGAELAPWTMLANALLNLDEAITKE